MATIEVTHSLSTAQANAAISKWQIAKAALSYWPLAFGQNNPTFHSALIRVLPRESAVRFFSVLFFSVPPYLCGGLGFDWRKAGCR